jgi:hypothetical protein
MSEEEKIETPVMTTEHSPTIGKIMLALSKAQGAMRPAVKDKDNYYKKKYADLASNWEAEREALTANELGVVQLVGTDAIGRLTITTILGHSSGEYFKSTVAVKPKDVSDTGYGISLTYWRRYTFQSITGGTAREDDDDGGEPDNKAMSAEKAWEKKVVDDPKNAEFKGAKPSPKSENGMMTNEQKTKFLDAAVAKKGVPAHLQALMTKAAGDVTLTEEQAGTLLNSYRSECAKNSNKAHFREVIGRCKGWAIDELKFAELDEIACLELSERFDPTVSELVKKEGV